MTAVKTLLHNLVAYLYPETYANIFIVLAVFFACYIYSFLFFGREDRSISTIRRILTGNIVLINILLVLLLLHAISQPVILGILLCSVAGICIWKKISLKFLKNQFSSAFTEADAVSYGLILLFSLLLPKIYSGFMRWDEMAYHLAYPQYWINQGGFKVDYSMRYPLYSFGNHSVYSLLLIVGSAATVKLYNGFFFLFFLFGVKELCRVPRMPLYYVLVPLLVVLTIYHFNEFSFTAFLEPALLVYTIYLVIECRRISLHDISEGRIRPFLCGILLSAVLISVKNFMLVYVVLLMLVLSIFFMIRHQQKWKLLLQWIFYAGCLLLLFNLVNIALCFNYTKDPLFPLLTLNFGSHFQAVWSPADIANLKSALSESGSQPKSPFNIHFMDRDLLLTLGLVIISVIATWWYQKKSAWSASGGEGGSISITWVLLSLLLTQFLFPNYLRYAYFLMPAFVLSCGLIFTYFRRLAPFFFLVILACHTSKSFFANFINHYTLSFKKENLRDVDLERITYGAQGTMDLLRYVHEHTAIDSISACDLGMYRWLFLKDGKTVFGDNVGKFRYQQICHCGSIRDYIIIPRKEEMDSSSCRLLYANKDYFIYKSE